MGDWYSELDLKNRYKSVPTNSRPGSRRNSTEFHELNAGFGGRPKSQPIPIPVRKNRVKPAKSPELEYMRNSKFSPVKSKMPLISL